MNVVSARLARATSWASSGNCNSTTSPTPHSASSQAHAAFTLTRPLATGRLAVRAERAS